MINARKSPTCSSIHVNVPPLQMSSLMAGVFSAQWQNFWMDDEDVSLICVMSSFIVRPAPDIFFFLPLQSFWKGFPVGVQRPVRM